MPQIIPQKHYVPITPELVKITPAPGLFAKVKKWFKSWVVSEPDISKTIKKLFDKTCESLELDKNKQLALWEYFKKHLDKKSKYSAKTTLNDALNALYSQLENLEMDNNKTRAVAEKLVEGIENCTEGFHNRVNELLLSLKKNISINAFLEQFRCEIVERVARQHTEEVHAFNRFFFKAAAIYGVPAINKTDKYIGAIPDSIILPALASGFSEYYQFWEIVNTLHTKIHAGLAEITSYEGEKKTGYPMGDFEKMITFLEHIIGRTNSPYEDWLILNKDSLVIDLNWPNIMYQLWQKLTAEGYISHSHAEKQAIHGLFNPDCTPEVFAYSLDDKIPPQHLFSNDAQLLAFLDTNSWLPAAKKMALFTYYMERNSDSIKPRQLLQLLPLLFRCNNADQVVLRAHPIWPKLLKAVDRRGDNVLALAITNVNKNTVQLISLLITALPSADQLDIYRHKRPSDYAVIYQHSNATLSRLFAEAEVGLLLMELKEKMIGYQLLATNKSHRDQELYQATSTLHSTLTIHFNNYLQSTKNGQALTILKSTCISAINESKKTILREYPAFIDIIRQILSFLTIIGAVHIICEARNNYLCNRSLFFPSETEKKINTFEDTLNELQPAHP